MQPSLLPGIHGLRAIAVLMILMFHLHFVGHLAIPDCAQVIATHFGMGVHLFFVISGFSLMYSTQVREGSSQWIQEYLLKRFFRIAPLYYTMLAFYVFVWPGSTSFRTFLISAAFAFNLVPGNHEGIVWASWTIGVEMIFYALLPLLFLLIRSTKGYVILCIVMLAVSYEGRYLMEVSGNPWSKYAHMAFISNAGYFCLGLMASAIFQSHRARFEALKSPATQTGATKAIKPLLVIVTLTCGALMLSPFGQSMPILGRPDIFLWGIIFAALVAWQAFFPSVLIAHRFFIWIGERSYSAYLLHPLLINRLIPINSSIQRQLDDTIGAWSFFVCAVMTLAILLLASAITYRFIERPGIEFGRRLISEHRAMKNTLISE